MDLLLILSLVIFGEAPQLLGSDRDAAAVEIGCVFTNRMDSALFPNDPQDVIASGFWGYYDVKDEQPPPWAKSAAQKILDCREWETISLLFGEPVEELCSDSLFLFSSHDIQTHGFDRKQADACYQNGTWGLCFFPHFPRQKGF